MRSPLRSVPLRLAQALTLLLCFVLVACDGDDDPTTPPMETQTIAELVGEDGDLSTLATAVETADLVDLLDGEDSFTVFAPNNAAFEDLTWMTCWTIPTFSLRC